MKVDLYKITTSDLQSLQLISRKTFYDTFSGFNTEENMNRYMDESFSTGVLEGELNNPGSTFYFAKLSGEVIGYLKLNFGDSQTELKSENSLEIERIYVLKEYQGMGIGYQFFQKALQSAKAAKVEFLWLGVWESNTSAIGFYERNGFVVFDRHTFFLGKDAQTDVMMKLKL